MKRTSKLIAIALVLVLAISMLPMSAMAIVTGTAATDNLKIKGIDITPELDAKSKQNMSAWNGSAGLNAGIGKNSEENFPLNSVSIPYEKMNDPTEDIVTWPVNTPAQVGQIKKISQAELDNFYENIFADGGAVSSFQNTFKSYGTLVTGKVPVEAGELYAIYVGNALTSATDCQMFFIQIVQSSKSGDLTTGGGTTGGGGVIGGGSSVQKGGINVVLPLNLNFVLDPLMLKSDVPGNQFSGTDFQIMNKSEIPVKVKFDIMPQFTASSSVNAAHFKKSGTVLKTTDPSFATTTDLIKPLTNLEVNGSTALFSMGILSAYLATAQPNFSTNAGGAYKYRIEETGAYIPMTVATPSSTFSTSSSISFLLAKPKSQGVYADNFTSIASFKFFGQLASGYAWKKDDIRVAGAYTISGFTSEGYAEKYGTQMFGLNGWSGEPNYRNFPADARVETNKVTRVIANRAAVTEKGGLTIAIRTDDSADLINADGTNPPPENKPSSSIGSIVNKTKTYTFTASDYSYLNMNGVLTIKSLPSDSVWNEIVITFGVGASVQTYTIWLSIVD